MITDASKSRYQGGGATQIIRPSLNLILDPSNIGLLDSYGYAPSQEQEQFQQNYYESTKHLKEYFGTAVVVEKKMKRRLRSAVANKKTIGAHSRVWTEH